LFLKVRQLRFLFECSEMSAGCGTKNATWNLNCELQKSGSSITTMCLLTQYYQLDNSWQNIQFRFFHNPPITWPLPSRLFFLFPELKITLKGRISQTVKDIITNATNDLKVIPQTSFE
jgi:hypothetical protein